MSGHTPGPWKWWTSNSWRRLCSDPGRGKSTFVLLPVRGAEGHVRDVRRDGQFRRLRFLGP